MAVITLSRQVAAWGDEVAQSLAKQTGYKFVTRKDIENRIVDLGFPKSKMPKYDERKPGFFASLTKNRDEYLNYAQYAILEAAAQGNVIIIGRGAFAVLQDVPNNVSVRLVADENTRITRLKNEFNWDDKQAKQRIQESDVNRAGFHASFYNVDIEDPSQYHAVLNTGFVNIDKAAAIIADIVKESISDEDEVKGNQVIQDKLKAQTIINKLYFEEKVNIEFMHGRIEGKTFILHGVSDSPAVVQKALQYIKKELPDYEAKSAVSVVQDFKTY